MKPWTRPGLAMAIVVALSSPTAAADPSISPAWKNLYFSMGMGVNWHDDHVVRIPDNTLTVPFSTQIDWEHGPVAVGALGWDFRNGFRAEVEASIRDNHVGSMRLAGPANIPLIDHSGRVRTRAVMFNALYDVGAKQGWPVYLTIGGGIGYAWQDWKQVGFLNLSHEDVRFNSSDGHFAYQGIVGLALPIRSVPGLELTGEYRYFATGDATLRGIIQAGAGGGAIPTTDADSQDHSLIFGVRYRFGAGRD